MRQHLDSTTASTEAVSFELAADSLTTVKPSAGEALTHAQAEDREWRHARRSSLSGWIRRLVKWGLLAEAASRIILCAGVPVAFLGGLAALVMPSFANGLAVTVVLLLLLAPLFYAFAWIVYVALGILTRWAKHEAILDELPTRRPLLWPGAPRPK